MIDPQANSVIVNVARMHTSYGFGLFSRVGLAGSGLPLIRMGLYESHLPSALIFFLLGGSVLLIGEALRHH